MSNRYHQLKVAVLVTDGFEQAELLEPKKAAATSRACRKKAVRHQPRPATKMKPLPSRTVSHPRVMADLTCQQ